MWEKIKSKDIKVKHIYIKEQLADFLTKVVPRAKLSLALSIGLVDIYAPAWGEVLSVLVGTCL